MTAADLILNARNRAGLTQADLALRAGVPRTSISRWEAATREPSLSTLRHVIAACGLALDLSLVNADGSLAAQVADQRALSPGARLESLLPKADARAAVRALNVVGEVRAPAVVIGQVAGVLQGMPQRPSTAEVEVVASDPVAFTEALGARRFVPTDDPRRLLNSDQRWTWTGPRNTSVTVATAVPGGADFGILRRDADELRPGPARVLVAHPRDLLRLAEASSAAAERARIPGLRALLD